MQRYHGHHIWIVGASSGIGRALAVELAGQGAILALSARRKNALDALNRELGGNHRVFPLDVANHTQVSRAAKAIQKAFPRLDSAIFMAAIYTPGTLDSMDLRAAHQVIDINLKGGFNVVHAVLPILRSQNNGQIILCASVSGYRGLPGGQPYSSTKAALINLAESLRCEETFSGIDVKVINSGFVETPMTALNRFRMPMKISAQQAARHIVKGMSAGGFEIHFPKLFTWLVKILRLLPAFLYFRVAYLRRRFK